MHPAIAPSAPGVVLQPAPLFAASDGQWNHGDGFAPGDQDDADYAGWRSADDGQGLEITDVHVHSGPNLDVAWPSSTPVWENFVWSSYVWSGGPVTMRRLEGHLRPGGLPLPHEHPYYGGADVGDYVDQAAFEVFLPSVPPTPEQQIVICVMTWQTTAFPLDAAERRNTWRQVYPGVFSPDGLWRNARVSFGANTDDTCATGASALVDRFRPVRPTLEAIASWRQSMPYWPIVCYVVPSVMHRQATLNEQRNMQLVQAVKLMLQQPSVAGSINPLAAYASPQPALTPQQVAQRCVVCMAGGSNGGLASTMAILRHPHLVHGASAEVWPPTFQRFYGEQDYGSAMAMLSGSSGEALKADDYMHWGQYAWAQGLEINDLSLARQFLAGRAYRSALFAVGDEDITTTGTEWVRLLAPSTWVDHGVATAPANPLPAPYVPPKIAWAVAENACHVSSVSPARHPATGVVTYSSDQLVHWVFEEACAQRRAELSRGTPPPPIPAVLRQRREPEQQLFGGDDPHEWALGHSAESLPSPESHHLHRDDGFFAAVQPDATGVLPGLKEAMFIRDGKVYVGSADGFVTVFEVDAAHPKQPLRRLARSAKLGHGPLTITPLEEAGTWVLVVGSRRHLHRLDRTTLLPLDPLAPPVLLPIEVSQPHHLQVVDVLPGHPGPELAFASMLGGLVFYSPALAPIHEWPELGITEFLADGPRLTILSSRGMLATVTFDLSHQPTLVAASRPLPIPGTYSLPDHATQGEPIDLERMRFDFTGLADVNGVGAVTAWFGDVDGLGDVALRVHDLFFHTRMPLRFNNPGPWVDLAPCRQSIAYPVGSPQRGDHMLALGGDGTLALIDQVGRNIAHKKLTATKQPGYWPFGADAIGICVGEMVGNSGSYQEEVVVATKTGLMWLHIDDLLTPGAELDATPGSGYWIDVARTGATGTAVQRRTNQTLSAAWAIARRPGDSNLHVLDQRGCYWQVGHDGARSLWERDASARGHNGWQYFGAVTGAAFGGSTPGSPTPGASYLRVEASDSSRSVVTTPWGAILGSEAVLQFADPPINLLNNWFRTDSPKTVFQEFLCFRSSGSVLPGGRARKREAWFWSVPGRDLSDWANLLEGFAATASGLVDSTWASVDEPRLLSDVVVFGTGCPHLPLRSSTQFVPAMQQQAVRAIRLPGAAGASGTLLVLGCPGGRVRIVDPGEWRTSDTRHHGKGAELAKSDDLGFGGSALATRVDAATGAVTIWFGTSLAPMVRPAQYGVAGGVLRPGELAVGAVHKLTWSPGASAVALAKSVPLHARAPIVRGGYAVTGVQLGQLVADNVSPGEELVVATAGGEIFLFNANTMAWVDQMRVQGATGFYNSILVEDLDSDGKSELYVGGSLGLWRFTQPGE